MSCPAPEVPPVPPTLLQLVEQLADLDPIGAESHREEVQELELRTSKARERLAEAEASQSAATPDGSLKAYEEWALRQSDVSGARRAVRLLGVDADVRREVLERALFMAREVKATGRERCRDCQGSGEGPQDPGGISIDYPPCDTCRGTGFASLSPGKAGTP